MWDFLALAMVALIIVTVVTNAIFPMLEEDRRRADNELQSRLSEALLWRLPRSVRVTARGVTNRTFRLVTKRWFH
jgi:hypothetical protein